MVSGTFNNTTRRYPKFNHFFDALIDEVSNGTEPPLVGDGHVLARLDVHDADRSSLGFDERVFGHAEAPGHGAAVVGAELVHFAVDAAVALVAQDRVDERAVGLVHLAQVDEGLGHRVVHGLQELLGERRRSGLGPWVG
jgi:hypothetical protein